MMANLAFAQTSEVSESNLDTHVITTPINGDGTIKGVVTDKNEKNVTLPFVNILIKGTKTETQTDIDGNYTLNVKPGKYTLIIDYTGYKILEIPVIVETDKIKTLNCELIPSMVSLNEVVITRHSNRQKESALLLDQKNAAGIVQSIGAQELSRKGISDVASAVAKTTGIAKQEDNGNIFVRGLGDRYNSTTMNGLPVPSNDPEKKNLNLEIFPTNILEYVSIDKVYNSKLYGDFSGGNVDIISKNNKNKGFLNMQFGTKLNTNALNEPNFQLQKGISGSGFEQKSIPTNPLTEYNYNTLELGSKTPTGYSGGISGGTSINVGQEGKLNILASANYGNEYGARSNGTAKGSVNGAGVANKIFDKYTYMSYGTNATALGNINYEINKKNKIDYNSLFINTSSQSKEEYFGYIADIANEGNGIIRRLNYEKNSLWINQLLGSHQIGNRSDLNWGVSYNTIDGSMPDRVQNIFRKENTGYVLSNISAPDNHRYFQKLTEKELATNLTYDYKFNQAEDKTFKGKLTVGINTKLKNRDFEATQFNFKSVAPYNNITVDPNNLDTFYNQENLSKGYFTISTFRGNSQVSNATKPQTYEGEQNIGAVFANAEYKWKKLTANVGMRGEKITQKVNWDTQLGGIGNDQLNKNAFLPSLVMKYELNSKQNLRMGLSKTYTLPQFKERALFVYEEVLQVKVGNPNLYESDDYNFDLKWELFPNGDEVFAVTGFGKYISNPINEVTISSSSNDISYINTGNHGYLAGTEIEIKKTLFKSEGVNLKRLSAGFNGSYLYSDQELDNEKIKRETNYQVDFTHKNSKFTGASDYLLNADLSFYNEWKEKKGNLVSTLSYNYFSDRLYTIGTNGKGNLVDKGYGALDLIFKSKISSKFGIDFSVKNILNPTINRVQENISSDINVLSYKKGLNLGFSLNYQF